MGFFDNFGAAAKNTVGNLGGGVADGLSGFTGNVFDAVGGSLDAVTGSVMDIGEQWLGVAFSPLGVKSPTGETSAPVTNATGLKTIGYDTPDRPRNPFQSPRPSVVESPNAVLESGGSFPGLGAPIIPGISNEMLLIGVAIAAGGIHFFFMRR